MAQSFTCVVEAGASELHAYLRQRMGHVEKISEDTFSGENHYVTVLMYEQYFWRVGNQVSLMIIIAGMGPGRSRLKTVSCGSSQGMIFKFDLGAAGDFAREPINYVQEKYKITWQQ
ncbi:MAG TPA: hypothetical protein GX699_00110 [Firmicutes bacterium]|nr:hypothetical protein [Bacillota bacterium]